MVADTANTVRAGSPGCTNCSTEEIDGHRRGTRRQRRRNLRHSPQGQPEMGPGITHTTIQVEDADLAQTKESPHA